MFKEKFETHFAAPLTTVLGRQMLGLALLAILLDQASKFWIMYGLRLPSLQQVKISPLFSFTMVRNDGVSFGLLSSDGLGRWLLVLFSLGVATFILDWLRKAERKIMAIGMALVAGGAIGNAIDRAIYGWVVDFIDVSGLGFPWVFNIADACINMGVVLLFVDVFALNRQASDASDKKQG